MLIVIAILLMLIAIALSLICNILKVMNNNFVKVFNFYKVQFKKPSTDLCYYAEPCGSRTNGKCTLDEPCEKLVGRSCI
jgi:hypothetical protein